MHYTMTFHNYSLKTLWLLMATVLEVEGAMFNDHRSSNVPVVKVEAMEFSPHVIFDARKTTAAGIYPSILNVIGKALNIRYNYTLTKEIKIGNKQDNERWNGLLGVVSRNETDIAALMLALTNERLKAADFFAPFEFTRTKFIVHAPRRVSKIKAFLRPFTLSMWISIGIALALLGIVFYAFLRANVANWKHNPPNFFDVFWLLFGTLSLQGGNLKYVKTTVSRLIISSWWLSVIVIASAYSGMLLSFVIEPDYIPVPRTLHGLSEAVEKKEYSCGTLKDTVMEGILLESNEKAIQILGKNIRENKNNLMNTRVEGFLKAKKQNYAYFYVENIARPNTARLGENHFVYSQDDIAFYSMSFPVRRGFPLKRKFDELLIRMFESGIIKKIKDDITYQIQLHSVKKERYKKSLGINDLKGPFFVLLCGYTLSIMFVVIEIFVSRNTRKRFFYNQMSEP